MPAGSWRRSADVRVRGWLPVPVAGALMVLALTGCGGSGSGTTSRSVQRSVAAESAPPAAAPAPRRVALRPATPPAPAAAPAAAPTSCATARSGSYTAGGASYLLSVPGDAVTNARPLPLVLDYHGYQQGAAAQEAYTGLGAYGAAHGVAVATPQGASGAWNFPRSTALRDDLAVSRAVVADVRMRLCGRVGGVGASGWSDGADMANLVACTGIARTVVGVAPSITPRGCTSWPPMVEVHGTADPFVSYSGGGGSRGGPFAGTEAQPAPARAAAWAGAAGCGPSRSYRIGTDVAVQRWDGCDVRLYTVEGGGHTWPSRRGSDPVPGLGRTTTTLDADALVVDFLTRHAA